MSEHEWKTTMQGPAGLGPFVLQSEADAALSTRDAKVATYQAANLQLQIAEFRINDLSAEVRRLRELSRNVAGIGALIVAVYSIVLLFEWLP